MSAAVISATSPAAGRRLLADIPPWKAKLLTYFPVKDKKRAATTSAADTESETYLKKWGTDMFVGGTGVKPCIEEILGELAKATETDVKTGKKLYRIGSDESDQPVYVTNEKDAWPVIIGDDINYGHSTWKKDLRIYNLRHRHTNDFNTVLAGKLSKDAARDRFEELNAKDFDQIKAAYDALSKEQRKPKDTAAWQASITELKRATGFTRGFTDAEEKTIGAWFKKGRSGEMPGSKKTGKRKRGDDDQVKLKAGEALEAIAECIARFENKPTSVADLKVEGFFQGWLNQTTRPIKEMCNIVNQKRGKNTVRWSEMWLKAGMAKFERAIPTKQRAAQSEAAQST